MNDPFDYEPHPLCRQAAKEVTDYVESQPQLLSDTRQGKMLGVLIVETTDGQPGYLAAYSGLLAGRNDWPFFVPPVYDAQQPDGHFKQTERQISALNEQVRAADPSAEDTLALRQQRKQMSEELQLWLFRQYHVLNALGEEKDLVQVWRDYHTSPKLQQRFPLPPGGTGDCCAPKLLQYAYQHRLRPVQIAEFWYGESPRGEVRHHGQFYPACRGKCKPVLTHMLQGLDLDETAVYRDLTSQLRILYSDDHLIVVSKPSGLLSVRGKLPVPSVESILEAQYGRVLMPHRLDMDTSGLMVVARTDEAYHSLQRQFLEHTVRKEYVALLEDGADEAAGAALATKTAGTNRDNKPQLSQQPQKPQMPHSPQWPQLPQQPQQPQMPHSPQKPQWPQLPQQPQILPLSGTISLPLRPDPLDRPRQVVDYEHGKPAVTDYQIIGRTPDGHTRVLLTPHTGRTHQLRMHCAHADGLGCPILGDNLYGTRAARLYLHAAELSFTHPQTGRLMRFRKEPDF